MVEIAKDYSTWRAKARGLAAVVSSHFCPSHNKLGFFRSTIFSFSLSLSLYDDYC